MGIDTLRIWGPESKKTFRSNRLDGILEELDERTSCKDQYEVITRTGLLITLIEVFSDPGKTIKTFERQVGYTGNDITSFTDIYYNDDTTEDSRVVQTLTRDGDGRVTECASVFSTTEPDDDC